MQKTNFSFEVLIHDDCSTDGTTDIIREYAEKYPDIIKPLYEIENQYQNGKPAGSSVWNIPRAQGKYIAMCEGDDYWTDPFKLQKQVDFLESHPDYALCYTMVKPYIQPDGFFNEPIGGGSVTFYELLERNTIPTLSILIRSDVYRSYIKEIKPEERKWLMGDYPLWLYASSKFKIEFQPYVSGVYRVLSESAIHSRNIQHRYKMSICYKEIALFYANLNTETPDYCKRRIIKHLEWLKLCFSILNNNEIYDKVSWRKLDIKGRALFISSKISKKVSRLIIHAKVK